RTAPAGDPDRAAQERPGDLLRRGPGPGGIVGNSDDLSLAQVSGRLPVLTQRVRRLFRVGAEFACQPGARPHAADSPAQGRTTKILAFALLDLDDGNSRRGRPALA